jgi:hypothetical protein
MIVLYIPRMGKLIYWAEVINALLSGGWFLALVIIIPGSQAFGGSMRMASVDASTPQAYLPTELNQVAGGMPTSTETDTSLHPTLTSASSPTGMSTNPLTEDQCHLYLPVILGSMCATCW